MMLELNSIRVAFGGVEALSDVDMAVPDGQFTGLIGPNGAGKTTLFNVITGYVKPLTGTVVFDGTDITSLPAHARVRLGIGRTFQHLELFASLTVWENVLVAAESGARWRRQDGSPADVARSVISLLGLDAVAAERAGRLTIGRARLVEVGRAVALEPRLLLLDEPSAGLDQNESRILARALAPLYKHCAVLVVEHDVDFVMSLCSTVHVLDLGRMLATGTPDQISTDLAVQRAYLGRPGETARTGRVARRPRRPAAEPVRQ